MTILIAYLLMAQIDAHPILYVLVFFLWLGHLAAHDHSCSKDSDDDDENRFVCRYRETDNNCRWRGRHG